ncbi:MAG: DUF3857 domain-containing protein [Bacteroidota bacterium]|nr:DUF3857 domain-containing protein [Bacteroidota bacterium]
MKKLLLFAIPLFATLSLTAQKNKNNDPDSPPFGKVDKADLLMKECDFDNKAEALVLVDEAQMDYILGSEGMEMKKRVRIKILSDRGFERANIHLPYESGKDGEQISNLEAQTYNLDPGGNIIVTKVDKKLIYDKKLNKRESEKVFTFPEVKAGSVIEYTYKESGLGLIDWYFQETIPVKYSRFTIDFPLEIEVNVTPYCSRQFEQKNESTSTRYNKTYVMRNVAAFRDEPYIINDDYYRDRLETKIIAWTFDGKRNFRVVNWMDVIKHLMEDDDFGVQLKKNIPRTADLDEKLKTITTPYLRMKTIYKYVQDNMQWNESTGIWALDGVKSAWKDKKGTVGEINLILVNLLKDAGLNAHPVLVSTHNFGVVNTMDAGTYDYPGYHQFNKVMAYVDLDDKNYVLDASEKSTPAHLIPEDVVSTEGLVIEKIETSQWGWKQLFDKDMLAKNIILVNSQIDETGKMSGEVTVTSFDYSRLDRLPTAKKGKDKFIEKYITGSNPGMKIDDVVFENLESDSLPLVQKIKFSQPLNSSGDYTYFSSNILTGLEKNPFIADNRFSDVFFGNNQSYLVIGNFLLPEGYEIETLPKNIRMIMSDTSISITRRAEISGNNLMTKVQLDFKKPFYPASQYEELHEFYKQLFDLLNEQFVMRKKK